ncbi:hypothetical protein BCR37DRAFT_375494 [Protomyces lactucae-debilis]|uniref:UBX domain-containing protein n=1 Tax=Protomyces lactucae-debilis TaxID=2754530 RepID=A0A1Y2FY75_PROLT|nr:uncharacterized protein BCR37DRAFT_375494 [Protomyces lactucae-debilis]ORY87625.1 hypothetical protein BCR37DRAFT_375494 [Protomyces lactucae-debilis]
MDALGDEKVEQFQSVTACNDSLARRYLSVAGGDLDTAVMLFFETNGQLPDDPSTTTSAQRPDSASDGMAEFEDEGMIEDDEAMARRLAGEWGANGSGAETVRAPIAPTRQVLQDDVMDYDPSFMPHFGNRFDALAGTSSRPTGSRGVFNQVAPSVWDEAHAEQGLREATGGASAQSAKSSRLARLFQPPFDLMAHIDLTTAREQAKEELKWIMINLQDNADFASQTLNRDLWKDAGVKELVRESFLFLQYTKNSEDGESYMRFYPVEQYPHIAILDPRTGERVKTWSKTLSVPDFMGDVAEFLDRFSLDDTKQNPIAKKPKRQTERAKAPAEMSEEDQINAAIMASVGGSMAEAIPVDEDEADVVIAEAPTNGHANGTAAKVQTALDKIEAIDRPEPPAGAETTRIQLRLPSSRQVRRFLTSDPVLYIFQYVKATVPEAHDGKQFKIVFNRASLNNNLEETIEQAGLKNASLVVEFEEDES